MPAKDSHSYIHAVTSGAAGQWEGPTVMDNAESNGRVNDPLISPREFCDQAKICPKTLRRIELRGEGPPAVEITPGLRRYRQSAVDAWFAAKTVTGARPAGRTPTEAMAAQRKRRGA
jgi:hypothetical protein